MTCAVNVAVGNRSIVTKLHRDTQGFLFSLSRLCPFGNFQRDEVVLWELGAIVELKRGDFFYFLDHLIHHSNEEVQGTRHSVVGFTEHRVWNWLQNIYGFKDRRVDAFRKRSKRHREEKERQNSCKRQKHK